MVGAALGLQLGIMSGWSPIQCATSAVMATAMSYGDLSPDGDQSWMPFKHRGFTHWVELPLIVGAILYSQAAPWFAWSLLVGWSSHLLADFMFGQAGWGHGQGVPFLFGRVYLGVGFKSGGALEKRFMVPYLLPAVLVAQAGFVIWPVIQRFL